jgi:hypothetical protein
LYARRKQKAVAAIVREALVEYPAARRESHSALRSFVGIAESGRTDTATRHEELLWAGPCTDSAPGAPARARHSRVRTRR